MKGMNLEEILTEIGRRRPVGEIELTWDRMSYSAEVFDRVFADPDFPGWEGDRPTGEEARVIVELLGCERGTRLLDLACGYGRHALVLAGEYGVRVCGVDISPGLIEGARRRAAVAGLEIDFEVGHGRDLAHADEFDRAMIAFNSFSLFSPEDAPVVLRGIHRALKAGGRLFMDLDNKPFNCRYGTDETGWQCWPGGLTLGESHFHADISVEVDRDLIFQVGAKRVEEFVIFKRIYSREEICALLAECGFRVGEVFGDWDLSAWREVCPKMLLTAERE